MVASFGVGLDIQPFDRLVTQAFGEPSNIPVAGLHCSAVQALDAKVPVASNMPPLVRGDWEDSSGGGRFGGIRNTDWWQRYDWLIVRVARVVFVVGGQAFGQGDLGCRRNGGSIVL